MDKNRLCVPDLPDNLEILEFLGSSGIFKIRGVSNISIQLIRMCKLYLSKNGSPLWT